MQTVAADMRPASAKTVSQEVPNAELVHDKFHIDKYLEEVVYRLQRAENKAFQAQDDNRLIGTRLLWLFNWSHLPHRRRCRLAAIRKGDLKTARALSPRGGVPIVLALDLCLERGGVLRSLLCVGGSMSPQADSEMLKSHLPNPLPYFRR